MNIYKLITTLFKIEDPYSLRYRLRVTDVEKFRKALTRLVKNKTKTEGLSVEQQARKMKIKETNLLRWMDKNNVSRPSIYNVEKLCTYYELTTISKLERAGIHLVRNNSTFLSDKDISALKDLRDELAVNHPALAPLNNILSKYVE